MKILAFETSCDETAAAVVDSGRTVLSNVVYSQINAHKPYGGVVPEIASRKHIELISQIADKAVKDAGIGFGDIGAIAVTCAPGLIGALLVGLMFAKSVALVLNVPFIPVHHVRGHIAANYIAFPNMKPPFTALSVSGGTSIIADVKDYTKIEIVGSTKDDAAGEAFDKVARVLGLGYPGGAALDELAQSGDPRRYAMPLSDIKGAPFDFSFSGLKTAAVNLLHNAAQRGDDVDLPSFCASLSAAVAETLAPRAIAATQKFNRSILVASGGVAANSFLRRRLLELGEKNSIEVKFPPVSLCGDNAAMIGAQAYYEFMAGNIGDISQNAYANADISENL